jgi:hypothetical protein
LTKGVSSSVLHTTLCKLTMQDIFVSALKGVMKKKT